MSSQAQPRREQRFEGMQQSVGQNGASAQPLEDIYKYCVDYARERPDVAALWCFGIGFVLGWKLKPW